jgi:hypothetical protein
LHKRPAVALLQKQHDTYALTVTATRREGATRTADPAWKTLQKRQALPCSVGRSTASCPVQCRSTACLPGCVAAQPCVIARLMQDSTNLRTCSGPDGLCGLGAQSKGHGVKVRGCWLWLRMKVLAERYPASDCHQRPYHHQIRLDVVQTAARVLALAWMRPAVYSGAFAPSLTPDQ